MPLFSDAMHHNNLVSRNFCHLSFKWENETDTKGLNTLPTAIQPLS
jgi:hypothetical protein